MPDPVVAPSSIEGRWVFPGRVAQQNATLKVRGQKVWGVICGPCTPEGVALIDDGTFDGTTMRFYINHIDTPPSPQQKGVRRNVMTGTLTGNVIKFKGVREGSESERGKKPDWADSGLTLPTGTQQKDIMRSKPTHKEKLMRYSLKPLLLLGAFVTIVGVMDLPLAAQWPTRAAPGP